MSKQRIVIKKIPKEPSSPQESPRSYASNSNISENNNYSYAEPSNERPWMKWLFFFMGMVVMLLLLIGFDLFFPEDDTQEIESAELTQLDNTDQYSESADFSKDILAQRTSLEDLLSNLGVPNIDAKELHTQAISDGVNSLESGTKYTIFNTENGTLSEIILEPKMDPYYKYILNVEDLSINRIEKKSEIKLQSMAAIIEGGLGQTFIKNNLDLQMIDKIEEIYAWSIDLFSLKNGDRFKILYRQEFLDDKPYNVLDIEAAYFYHNGEEIYAFKYLNDEGFEYYNQDGQSMKKSFLKSPIKYGGVITSGFGLRVHPVQQYSKMHYGTDFAAPEGTPIVSVADGVVSKAMFTSNNGNYVKVKHDNTFSTQYLHMTRWADGMRPGTRVRQGDVIGYVGSTGLATGPHVCFRFWKDNKQVDPKKENQGISSRLSPNKLQDYLQEIEDIKRKLNKVEFT